MSQRAAATPVATSNIPLNPVNVFLRPLSASPNLSNASSSVAANPAPRQAVPADRNVVSSAGNAASKTTPIHKTLTDGLIWSAIFAIVLVIFIALITWKSASLDWPLASLPVRRGVLLMTILVKVTDWALEGLGDIAWEKLCWGPFMQRSGNLLTHLVLASGLGGSWDILRYPPQNASPSQSRTLDFVRRYFRFRWARLWALCRILVWLSLQFPGLIIMSSANTRTAYRPAGWSTVSGGLGIFNASLAFQTTPGDYVANSYLFNILQDKTMAFNTEAASQECRDRDTCESTLLVGGLKWIAPWPYQWLSDPDLTIYLTRDMPVYQLEGWNTTYDRSVSWSTSECRVYQAADQAIQICAKNRNNDGSIITGIRACDVGMLDDEGDCSLDPRWPGWNTFVAFSTTLDIYRLNISLVADRRSSTILDVTDKGEAARQVIRPSEFLDSFDNLLCPFVSINSTISRYCEAGQARADLVINMYYIVYNGYYAESAESSAIQDMLRNLYATALFEYNPVYRGAISRADPVYSRKAQDGLANENYFPGSAARMSLYFAPDHWTVLAFIVSGSVMVGISLAAVLFGLWFETPKISAFEPLNTFKLALTRPTQGGAVDLETLAQRKTDKEFIQAADGSHVKLKQT